KPPYHLAPWVAMAAMAVAALWRGRRNGDRAANPPRQLTPAELDAAEPGRGRCAQWPTSIPPLGWKDIFWRTYREMGRDRLPALAGGVTFYILLATFPAIAAFVSLYGIYNSDVTTVERQLGHLSNILPRDAVALLSNQMVRLASHRHATLGAAFVVSTLLSIWSANAGMKALFDSLNITFDETEKRDYLRRSIVTYIATFGALVFLALVVGTLVGAPAFFHDIGLRKFGRWWGPVRWMAVFVFAACAFSMLYRFGPSRRHARWRWVAFGGVVAALAWLGGALVFSWYVNNIANFGMTYGSIGAVIAYMLWVWVSVTVVLVGAELNAEVEHQTAIDTTVGGRKPIGQRGAVMADTVGKAFTTSPREAADWFTAFCSRQVGYVLGFLRRIARFAA
ncbi:MAG TPA: YihY/virulence factor BrkB family protein, partial [Caulobacteraceae bacterium]|nr:YihY/virulence factor BrkB family protein [Caulobacteraceae bacterium]